MAVGPLRSDVERVLSALAAVRQAHRRWRDFTRVELLSALVEVCMRMTVYRAYVRQGEAVSEADRHRVLDALDKARSARPDLEPEVFDLFDSLLLGELPGPEAATFLARFQQLTGPLAAKGEEDTALYRFTACLAACEVGMDPGKPCVDPGRFHRWCQEVAKRLPTTMLTTSTHDTKRSEDVRARLAVLTEDVEGLVSGLQAWEAALVASGATLPQAADLWALFQTLVGAWPIDAERLWTVVQKSLREAKLTSSWAHPDPDYEALVEECCRRSVEVPDVAQTVEAFAAGLIEPGRVNSLATVVLRLLCPGVPDTYQGTESWDLSLVDPDNRRPVDFADLSARLDRLGHRPPADHWVDASARQRGDPKLSLVATLLRLRAERPECFGPDAGYEPVPTSDQAVVAFSRAGAVVALVPRFPGSCEPSGVTVHLPARKWTNVCTGASIAGGPSPFGEVRGAFPVAVLLSR
jgi:(1->4)-alpha-D-glucan 1-alpha-D-glucosylmutase